MQSNLAPLILEVLRAKEGEFAGPVAFARALGVSPALWVTTRDGKRPLGAKLAATGATLIPVLEPLVIIFLRYDLPFRKSAVRGLNYWRNQGKRKRDGQKDGWAP